MKIWNTIKITTATFDPTTKKHHEYTNWNIKKNRKYTWYGLHFLPLQRTQGYQGPPAWCSPPVFARDPRHDTTTPFFYPEVSSRRFLRPSPSCRHYYWELTTSSSSLEQNGSLYHLICMGVIVFLPASSPKLCRCAPASHRSREESSPATTTMAQPLPWSASRAGWSPWACKCESDEGEIERRESN